MPDEKWNVMLIGGLPVEKKDTSHARMVVNEDMMYTEPSIGDHPRSDLMQYRYSDYDIRFHAEYMAGQIRRNEFGTAHGRFETIDPADRPYRSLGQDEE